MKLIYIAGPYTAETTEGINANIAKAEEIGQAVFCQCRGFIPVIPHTLANPLKKYAEFMAWQHQDWMDKFCFPLLKRCDAIMLIENWHLSKGARMEKDYAERHDIPVIENLQEIVTL